MLLVHQVGNGGSEGEAGADVNRSDRVWRSEWTTGRLHKR
jgi:hypothetical protein